MEAVYLETSFISYLVSLPARDLIVAAHQQITNDWWQQRRFEFRCVISQVVLDEISTGDETEVAKRLDIARDIDILATLPNVDELIKDILASGVLPPKAIRDVAHIALTSVHGVEYMLTWNCKHLANMQITRQIDKICRKRGVRLPLICTPEALMGGAQDD